MDGDSLSLSLSLTAAILKFMKESLTSAPRSASCQNGRTDKGVDELNTKDRLLFRQTYLSNINSRDGRKKNTNRQSCYKSRNDTCNLLMKSFVLSSKSTSAFSPIRFVPHVFSIKVCVFLWIWREVRRETLPGNRKYNNSWSTSG